MTKCQGQAGRRPLPGTDGVKRKDDKCRSVRHNFGPQPLH